MCVNESRFWEGIVWYLENRTTRGWRGRAGQPRGRRGPTSQPAASATARSPSFRRWNVNSTSVVRRKAPSSDAPAGSSWPPPTPEATKTWSSLLMNTTGREREDEFGSGAGECYWICYEASWLVRTSNRFGRASSSARAVHVTGMGMIYSSLFWFSTLPALTFHVQEKLPSELLVLTISPLYLSKPFPLWFKIDSVI